MRSEVDLHLEQFIELVVGLLKHVIGLRLTDEDDLHVEGNGLWFECFGDHQAHVPRRVGRTQFPRPEGTLQCGPHHRAGEKFLGMEDQVSAIGPVQGSRRNPGEICDHDAKPDLTLHPAEEVPKRRVRFDDHGGSSVPVSGDHRIHQVADEKVLRGFPHEGGRRRTLFLSLGGELLPVLDNVLCHCVQVLQNAGAFLIELF